jgi:hypothetical protein
MKNFYLFAFIFFTQFALSNELFKGENLLVEPPSTEIYKAYYKEKNGLKSTTWASIELITKDTFTVNILSGSYSDLNRFRNIQDKPGKKACSKFDSKDIDKFDRNGYQSLFWETTCILNGTPIQALQLAISGNDSLYHIRKLWQFQVSDSDYSDWKEQMIQISVCDTRKKRKMKHPCPSFK